MTQKASANVRIRPNDHAAAKAEAHQRRTDIANVISAWRHRWENSSDEQRQASFESYDQSPEKSSAAARA